MQLVKKCAKLVVSIIFPLRCPVCDKILEPELQEARIHPHCYNRLYPVQDPVCMQCGRPIGMSHMEWCYDCERQHRQMRGKSPIQQGKALYIYQGIVKESMYRFKYSNKQEYAEFFAEEVLRRYGDWLREKQIEAIVPVPMYRKKQRKRGYNQAEVFAKALSQQTGIPVDTKLIWRVKDTTPQKELNDTQRKNNLKNAFHASENIVQYKRILVVDDIYTTGSTAEAVAEVLKRINIDSVYFMSICIGKGA